MRRVMIQGYDHPKYGWRYRIVNADDISEVIDDCQGMGFRYEEKALNYAAKRAPWIVIPNPDSKVVEMAALF